MQIKPQILILSALTIFGVIYYLSNKTPIVTKPNENSVMSVDVIKENAKTEIKKTHSETTLKDSTDLQLDSIEKENIVNVYDSDPVVDSAMMIENNRMCYGFLSKRFNSLRVSYILDNNYDEKQKNYHENYIDYCNQLNQSNPELKLSDIAAIESKKTTAKATSLWGKIVSREIDASTLSEYEQLDLLRQNNLNILSNAPNYLREYYNKVIHWDLEDVLQNHQYDYVNLIQDYAHNLYLCQNGKDCGPNSSHMALICLYLTSEACGLDYVQFINQVLTPGQQSDIAIATSYLTSKYQ